jgi:hypothetical protein
MVQLSCILSFRDLFENVLILKTFDNFLWLTGNLHAKVSILQIQIWASLLDLDLL